MKCPVCDAPLRAIQKYGVEIDICPGCKGVWLDRGELEKIIALEAAGGPVQETLSAHGESRPREAAPPYREESRHRDDHDDDTHQRVQYDQHGRPYKKKRESWLGELLGGFGGDD
jgi:Zn-finger nucleic acid-binding protein